MVIPAYKKKLLALYGFILGLLLVWHVLLNYYNPFLFESRIDEATIIITIDKGDNAKKIAKKLYAKKAIPSEFWFLNYVFLKDWEQELKYGKYEIFPDETPVDIIEKIHRAYTVNYRMTIIEGWKFSDLKAKLDKLPYIKHTLKNKTNKQIAKFLDINPAFLDGAFLPNTYYYTDGETDIALLRRARMAMKHIFKREYNAYQRLKSPLLHSSFSTWSGTVDDEYNVLSLASIIEKETFVENEYPLISSVFHNRLLKGMRLQADPTVIYAVGDRYKGRIRTRHLRFKSPYNTYTTKGLPPFPIAYAGERAIKAAFNPKETDFIYFVAKGNGREHWFNSSLDEHNKAVERYWDIIAARKKRKNQ